jgi:hypothetical protein
MRAALLFLAYAFDLDGDHVASPTDDPEDLDLILVDEYSTGEEVSFPRALQANATNFTIPPPPEESSSLPMAAMLCGGVVAAGVAGFLLCRPAYTYETYDYDHAADSGLLDHPDYDVHEYDEESE